MKIEKEFIPYEQSLALKELGFRESCFAYYNNHSPKNNHQRGFIISQYSVQDHNEENEGDNLICSAPLYQQAFRWFKEKYKLMSCITPCSDGEYIFTLYDLNKCDLEVFVEDIEIMESEDSYEFFEEAELECLKKLIDIVKLSHKTATI